MALNRSLTQMGAVGALAGGLSFASLVPGAAAFETQLRDMAITAGNTGRAVSTAVVSMRDQLQGLALGYRESSADIANGLQVLLSRGIDPAIAQPMVRVLTEVRSASGAATQDLAQLGVAFDRLAKIQGLDGMRQAFATALRGGQLGGAELKDMARYLPEVLASMDAVGVSGMRAIVNSVAMLQVVRDGVGTMEGASAGTNQLLGQLLSPETIERAKKFGFDIVRIRENAMRRMKAGEDIDPVEAIIQTFRQIDRMAPGGIMTFLTDQNARTAFLAFNAQLERYLELQRQLRATTPEVIRQTGADRREGLGAEQREFEERVSQLRDRLGNALGGVLPDLLSGLDQLRSAMAAIDERFPGLIDGTVKWGAVLAVLVGTGGALGMLLAALNPLGVAIALVIGLLVAVSLRADEINAAFGRLGARVEERLGPIADVFTRIRNAVDGLRDALLRFSGRELAPSLPAPSVPERQRNWQNRGRARGFYGDEPPEDPDNPIRRQSAPGGDLGRGLRPAALGGGWTRPLDPAAARAGADQSDRQWTGRIEIALADGLVIRRRETNSGAVTITTPDRGLMLRGV